MYCCLYAICFQVFGQCIPAFRTDHVKMKCMTGAGPCKRQSNARDIFQQLIISRRRFYAGLRPLVKIRQLGAQYRSLQSIEATVDTLHLMMMFFQGAMVGIHAAFFRQRIIMPVDAFANFRRIRIPRVHGVQRLSISNARFKHMRDSAAQKDSIASGKSSVHGSADWVWGYDPIGEWDKAPFVPTSYAA